uniref:PPARG coactivator 1 alpha n=1 Tax=Rhinolophus ferrumequinum TaxID=59479 RepID=A0A671DW81_RHIFE
MAWDMCNQDSVWSDIECAALVGEDQPLCPDLPELDLSELDVNDLDTDSFLGGLKWCSDQSEIISNQYNNEPSNIFEVRTPVGKINFSLNLAWAGLTWL